MRTSLAITVLLMLLFQLSFPITGRGKGITTEKVTLGLNDESLETAINKIEQQTTFRFFYHEEDIKPLVHLNLAEGTRTVEQTLEILLQNTFLSFREMENNILLVREDRQSYYKITGRVVNSSDKKPVANASVFLNNSAIGAKTADDGTFKLNNAKPGKYDMVVSFVGFETYRQTITVNDKDIALPDIEIKPQAILLSEVKIKPVTDAAREKYYGWFKDEFLGTTQLAQDCKILNPEILDFDYDEETKILTATSQDFLEIENDALGYKIRYLLTNFKLDNRPFAKFRLDYGGSALYGELQGTPSKFRLAYGGSVLFEEMKGTPSQEKRWLKRRQEVYEGSIMHFLRSALNNQVEQQGFRALRLKKYANPERPADSLIEDKIKFYKKLRSEGTDRRDSLSFWNKKAKLPKIITKLEPAPLHKEDLIKPTSQPGLFAIGFGKDSDALYVTYNKHHHYIVNIQSTWLNGPDNKESTMASFNAPFAFFDRNGWLAPDGLIFNGVWAANRVAELLPVDYEPPKETIVPEDSTITNKIIAKLSSFDAAHNPEKAYLQFDKPYYAAGDTIYFKAYATMGQRHELSNLSGVLHVDLVNTNGKIDQTIKLKLDSGITFGDFALPDSLPGGNYRVRAYTRWMLNDSDPGFFEKNIEIGSIKNTQIPESILRKPAQMPRNKTDIQFFPEGGSLVTGIRSKIAFKAIDANGLGINVKGKIVDDKNNEITGFSSIHLGMGYFYLEPEEGRAYKARLTFADGEQSVVDLPTPDTKGIALSVNNDHIPQATVRIQANKVYYRKNRDKDYTFIIYSGGVAASIVRTLDSPAVSFDILKRHLHSGVARITLFSPEGEPLCERLLFIQNYDRLNLDVISDKTIYTPRGKVNLKLNALNRAGDPAEGHFSVSVTDESKVPVDENSENTILNNLLLTSDLKGYVEQPNYYFTDTSTNAAKNLDVLMLTQGYRRFTWKQVLSNKDSLLAYQPEKGLEINGMIKNLLGKPIPNGRVSLVPSKGGPVLSSVSDDKGIFHFSNLVFTDTAHFVLSAVNEKGKNSTKISYFGDRAEPVTFSTEVHDLNTTVDTAMVTYLNNAKNERNEVINYGRGKGIMLKEVKIKDKKLDDQYNTQSLAGAGNADQVMHANEIERVEGALSTSLDGRLHGVTFVRQPDGQKVPVLTINIMDAMPFNPPTPMLVVVDGVEGTDINGLQASDIETVEVLKYANATIYGMNGGAGVLIITTKHGGGRDIRDIASIGILPIAPMGFYKAREFYSPKYENTSMAGKWHDYRSTIYWQPELTTGKDGSASFGFYNADGKGTYRVVIEGIDDKGNLGRQVYMYKVE